MNKKEFTLGDIRDDDGEPLETENYPRRTP